MNKESGGGTSLNEETQLVAKEGVAIMPFNYMLSQCVGLATYYDRLKEKARRPTR